MWFLDYQASCSIKHTSSHFICIKFYFKLPSTDKTREKKWELRNLITGWGWIGCCKIQEGRFYFTTIYWQLDKAQILGTLSTLAIQLSFNNEYPHQFNPHLLYSLSLSLSLSLADSMPYKTSKLYIHTINNKHKWNYNFHKINLGYQACLHESP